MQQARRYGTIRPLHDFAEVEQWGDSIAEWQRLEKSRAAQTARDALGNEVRWGDVFRQQLVIPAASAVEVQGPLGQIVDVRVPARSWTMALTLRWENITLGDPADTLIARFVYEIGVGSARAAFFTSLAIPQVSPININSVIIEPFPAATIVVSAFLDVVPNAGAARTYAGTMGVLVAPVTR